MRTPLFAKGNKGSLHRMKTLRLQAQREKAARVVIRLNAIMLSVQKNTNGEIARLLQIDRSRVHAWVRAWNQHGLDGLLEGHRSGRPQRLSPSQIEHLKDILESGPVAYGLNTGIWTSTIMAEIIRDECAIEYHPGHVRRLLSNWGFSVQQPTTRLVQADPAKRNRWIRYDRPCIKKKPKLKEPLSFTKMKPPSDKRPHSTAPGQNVESSQKSIQEDSVILKKSLEP